jgi:hypothetical protein
LRTSVPKTLKKYERVARVRMAALKWIAQIAFRSELVLAIHYPIIFGAI